MSSKRPKLEEGIDILVEDNKIAKIDKNIKEEVDKTMQELASQNYNMIVLSNEIAGFSEDIIKKYQKNKDINIIISPRKGEE